MANQFDVFVPNVNQGFESGQQGYSAIAKLMQGREVEGARRDVAAAYQAGDPNAMRSSVARLMTVDPQGAAQLIGINNNERDFQFRQQEATRAQGNADRSFGLQKQQADDAAKGYDYREVDDGNGGKTLVRIHKVTGQTEKVQVAGAPETPNNPYAYGKQNEGQSKDSGYANRMFRAEGVLRDPKGMAAYKDRGNIALDKTPIVGASGLLGIGNSFLSDDYQKYDQASRDFINATLRRESGAAISESEFNNAYKQYLPRPGDSDAVLAEKQKNRQGTIASIAGGGGPTYKPPFSFGPNGEMNATGNAQQGVVQPKAATAPQPKVTMPKQGEVRDGYSFRGGNPADPANWGPVK